MSSRQPAGEDAIDLSHHLSTVSRHRGASPLKGLQKYFGKPGLISLAGGLPSPAYFPFDSISAASLAFDAFSESPTIQDQAPLSWFWQLFNNPTTTITIPKFSRDAKDLQLATALQYGLASGLPQLNKVCMELVTKIYKPPYANYTTLLHAGNTDAWAKTVTSLCDPGEGVLCSEWTYPSAMSAMLPYGISPVPISMDKEGMSSDALRDVLSHWDDIGRKMPRPHVMYIVPVGQNPTGATMYGKRKKEIYDICVEFDVIIVEDDPYYFLQEGSYSFPGPARSAAHVTKVDDQTYIDGLAPSFLRYDRQGRVIRLDTFSKTIAPGCRLGWMTCNPMFAERITRASETSTQQPCGFSQALVASLLMKWQFGGYLRWLRGLAAEYTHRRDFILDQIFKKFEVELAPSDQAKGVWRGQDVYMAYQRDRELSEKLVRRPVLSFVPPTSGMFIWLQLILDSHPQFNSEGQSELETKLWIDFAEEGLLIGPGSMFAATPEIGSQSPSAHYRVSFSNASFEDIEKAVNIMAKVIDKFYRKN